MSKFAFKEANPHHVSVGAILVNDEGFVCTHYFDSVVIPDTNETVGPGYILMRETLEDNETLEQAVHRGLSEEFGAEGEILGYLGPIAAHISRAAGDIEKLTLYFAVRCTEWDVTKRNKTEEDYENSGRVIWVKPNDLIKHMKEQGNQYERGDIDESYIVERFVAKFNS